MGAPRDNSLSESTGIDGRLSGLDASSPTAIDLRHPPQEQTEDAVTREALPSADGARRLLEHEVRRREVAESTLKTSETLYRLLYDNNPSMYFTLSPDGTVLSVNQFGASQLGYAPRELINRSILAVFKPEDHQTVLGQLVVCAAAPLKVFRWEIQKIRKDGSLLWVRERAQAVRSEQGRTLVLVVCEDISDRRATEEQIRESEERWRALFEHAGVGIAQMSLNGTFLRVNPRLCEILGYSSRTLMRQTFGELTHPDDLDLNRRYLRELLGGARPSFSMEKRYRRADGSWLWVNLTTSLVRNGSSEPAYFIAVIEDISERKHSEQALRESEQAVRSLQEATSAPGMTPDERIRTILALGCRRFRLPIGVLTRLDNEHLTLSHVWPPDGSLSPGMRLPLCQTYCSAALESDEPVCVEHASASEWHSHPGYLALGIETYIGAKVAGQQRLYGTICFMDKSPRATPFIEADKDFLLLMAQWISGEFDRLQVEERLKLINECFLQFESDPLANINRLTALAGELLEGTCALYSRMGGDLLSSIGTWHTPADFNPMDRAEGHLCCDLIRRGGEDLLTVRHLSETPYVDTDPNVRRYQLQTYIGKVVTIDGLPVGSLCVVFQRDFIPTEADERLMGILASAIGTEEQRIRSQKALRDSEERFRLAFRSSPHPVLITEFSSGRCLEVNDAALRLFSYSREEVVGQTTILLGIWPSLEDRRAFFEQLEREGSIANREVSLLSKDRTERQLLVSCEIVVFNGERCLITVGNDITQRKQAENALRESEERFAKAFRSSPYPIVISELESGLCLDANDAAIHLFGYRREEVAGRTADEIGLWPTPEHRRMFTKRLKEAGAIRNVEVVLRMKSGHFRHCLISAELIDLNGRRCMVTIGTDVTEQKRAEKALRESELRWQRFVSEAPVGLVIVDSTKRLLSANKAFCDMTGYTEQEVLSHTYALYTHPDDLPGNLKLTDEFFEGKRRGYTCEKRYIRKQGDVIWVTVKTTPIELPNHPGLLLLAVVQDITEQKRVSEEKERLSQDLHDNILQSLYAIGMQLEAGKLVAARSAKQSKQRMTQAIAQLNDLVKDVRQFIALLKHNRAPAMDFRQALHRLVESLSSSGQAKIEFHLEQRAIDRIAKKESEQLLNIAREALSNSVRHARATRQSIELKQIRNAVSMKICDDGVGFHSDHKLQRGHGLANMAARARTIGARFTLESHLHKGTCVTVELPLEDQHVGTQD